MAGVQTGRIQNNPSKKAIYPLGQRKTQGAIPATLWGTGFFLEDPASDRKA